MLLGEVFFVVLVPRLYNEDHLRQEPELSGARELQLKGAGYAKMSSSNSQL
jgi:hypothetical protein